MKEESCLISIFYKEGTTWKWQEMKEESCLISMYKIENRGYNKKKHEKREESIHE